MRYHHDQRQGHPGQQQQQQQQEPHVSHLNNPPGPPHPANKALLATLMLAAALVGFAAGAWTGGAGAHAAAGCSTGGKYELVARHGFKGHQQHQQGHQRRQAVAAAGPGAGEQHVRSLRSAYGAAYCDLHGIGPSGGFCLQPPAPAATAAAAAGATAAAATAAAATAGLVTGTLLDRPLCDAIARLVAGAHVADFGAGRGQYGTCLVSSPAANANNGYNASSAAASAVTAVGGSVGAVSYTAYDGGEGVEAVTGGAVRFLDLAEPTWLGVGYDWVVSLEVGEHIPPHLEAAFLGNLIRHARRGLLGGGALRHNATAAAQLRAASSLAWFRNTLLVFDRV
eukprot:XP_001701207.1 hypothetical protein CHLREDRAFT_153390 [Chlamydomonas reinhardtii]